MVRALRRLNWSSTWILWWAVGLHVIWGAALLLSDTTSSLLILVGLNRLLDIGLSPHVLGALLLLASLVAVGGLLRERNLGPRWALLALLPQYALLLIALFSDIEALYTAKNLATGADVDRVLLMTVLGPVMWAAVLHTLAIIERFVLRWSR